MSCLQTKNKCFAKKWEQKNWEKCGKVWLGQVVEMPPHRPPPHTTATTTTTKKSINPQNIHHHYQLSSISSWPSLNNYFLEMLCFLHGCVCRQIGGRGANIFVFVFVFSYLYMCICIRVFVDVCVDKLGDAEQLCWSACLPTSFTRIQILKEF